MIFLWNNVHNDEEEEEGAGLNDELLAELSDDELDDDDLPEGADAPVPLAVIDPVTIKEEEDPEEVAALLDSHGDENEEDMEYDSFDDKDEM